MLLLLLQLLMMMMMMMRTTTIILYFQQQQSQKFTKICILQKKRFEQLQSYSPCKKSFSYPTNIKFCISFMFKNPSFTHLLVLFLYPPILSFLFLVFFYIYIVIVQKTGRTSFFPGICGAHYRNSTTKKQRNPRNPTITTTNPSLSYKNKLKSSGRFFPFFPLFFENINKC